MILPYFLVVGGCIPLGNGGRLGRPAALLASIGSGDPPSSASVIVFLGVIASPGDVIMRFPLFCVRLSSCVSLFVCCMCKLDARASGGSNGVGVDDWLSSCDGGGPPTCCVCGLS